jgi:hypothetical protein
VFQGSIKRVAPHSSPDQLEEWLNARNWSLINRTEDMGL